MVYVLVWGTTFGKYALYFIYLFIYIISNMLKFGPGCASQTVGCYLSPPCEIFPSRNPKSDYLFSFTWKSVISLQSLQTFFFENCRVGQIIYFLHLSGQLSLFVHKIWKFIFLNIILSYKLDGRSLMRYKGAVVGTTPPP